MAAHGTRRCYINGCRCDNCTESNRLYFRQRRASLSGQIAHPSDPGPVELGVQDEIAELCEARPGLAQIALTLARILDNPKVISTQPSAAKVLVVLLDKLRKGSNGRESQLASVREMTSRGCRRASYVCAGPTVFRRSPRYQLSPKVCPFFGPLFPCGVRHKMPADKSLQ
jgi:hypothetical protein